jgi:hypothetical protein
MDYQEQEMVNTLASMLLENAKQNNLTLPNWYEEVVKEAIKEFGTEKVSNLFETPNHPELAVFTSIVAKKGTNRHLYDLWLQDKVIANVNPKTNQWEFIERK